MDEKFIKARDLGLASCHVCDKVVRLDDQRDATCPRCHSKVHYRKHNSLNRAWALLISAFIMYIPANTEAIMLTGALGQQSSDTIISGILYFLAHGDWPLALVIFSASVLLPLLKIMAIAYLLIMVNRENTLRKKEKTRLYLIAEVMGRWSMVDVFVVALLAALIQLGELSSIEAGPAGLAFAAMVILTMLSAMAFDPKLIWDTAENKK
ncbi:MAG: paraquat-inducible membrane protein A [endosymbiont of Galathealinum brachiosum]|uniref:Paraquat-inducible membrane protein A n=1 Tax=endosymbiont of Galathealinum brachiosum TaxID=2200906 RepID=A0A370DCN2_9GAMM|nr:MAG: paraquat-inducible membrane protein A [endosymbiont of Galathealinum brachiosum]